MIAQPGLQQSAYCVKKLNRLAELDRLKFLVLIVLVLGEKANPNRRGWSEFNATFSIRLGTDWSSDA
jgi:hypothetical protein